MAQTVARETHKKVLAPYLVPPAVFYLNQVFRWKRLVELAPQQAEQPVAKPAPAPVKQKRSRLRRFKSLCAAAAHALPLSGLRAVAVHAAQQLTSLSAVASFSTVAVGGLALGVAAKGVRRWHAARRSAKRAMVAINAGPAAEVAIMTYNIRAVMDRWPERAPMLRRCLKQADADVYCFQEVLTGEGTCRTVYWDCVLCSVNTAVNRVVAQYDKMQGNCCVSHAIGPLLYRSYVRFSECTSFIRY